MIGVFPELEALQQSKNERHNNSDLEVTGFDSQNKPACRMHRSLPESENILNHAIKFVHR